VEDLAEVARVFMVDLNSVVEMPQCGDPESEGSADLANLDMDWKPPQSPGDTLIGSLPDDQSNNPELQPVRDRAGEQFEEAQETAIGPSLEKPHRTRQALASGTKVKRRPRRAVGRTRKRLRRCVGKWREPYAVFGTRGSIYLTQNEVNEHQVHKNQPASWHKQKENSIEGAAKSTFPWTGNCWKPKRLLLQIADFSPGEECCGI
jgi:hypothetical protein